MWKCAVLISVCYLGLVVAQGLSDNLDLKASHHPACGKNEYFEKCTFECPAEKTCENRLIVAYCPDVIMPCIPKCSVERPLDKDIYKQRQAELFNTRGAGNMWRCAVLLSVCWVELVASQGLLGRPIPSLVPMECGPNEIFNECVPECPPEKTCDTRKVGVACLAISIPCSSKCVCKEGYYRKTAGGECISDEECGPACGANEEYTECRNPCVDDSCAAMGSLKPNCTEPCEPGCACKEGFFRLYNYWPCFPRCYCHELRDAPECRG
ncbi:unnamed protein product [Spodoptera littoralis]|uniref:TIL domain-containing protein n=1 Tax=Spodoptera littoralis TaxID=7109 RepID=A0A9P0ICC6_SPOLI|nr:unnamed protein product [Spodoptera littoralis]CAH1644143.1 unnamed protein product [Spodoptera littoralis]